MAMEMKAGASLNGLDPIVYMYGIPVIDAIHRVVIGRDAIITAGTDGQHMAGSLHYRGRALDVRTRDLTPAKKQELRDALARGLGPGWDVIVEPTHIHIEYDPK